MPRGGGQNVGINNSAMARAGARPGDHSRPRGGGTFGGRREGGRKTQNTQKVRAGGGPRERQRTAARPGQPLPARCQSRGGGSRPTSPGPSASAGGSRPSDAAKSAGCSDGPCVGSP